MVSTPGPFTSVLHLLFGVLQRFFGIGLPLAHAVHLDRALLSSHVSDDTDPDGDATEERPASERERSPAEVLRSLLDESMYTNPDQSRARLHRSLLEQLLPDHARLLAALADGTEYPVVHVGEPGADPILRNASTIGRRAGVSLPNHTPLYVSRLMALGLAEIGPESSAMRDDYEMLMTEPAVNAALSAARTRLRPARVVRRTLRITELGREVWGSIR